jgi:hypothetical protein
VDSLGIVAADCLVLIKDKRYGLKKHHQLYKFLEALLRASSSASIVNIVTVHCFVTFQSIGSPKRRKTKPAVLQRVTGLFSYVVSLTQKNGVSMLLAEYLIEQKRLEKM